MSRSLVLGNGTALLCFDRFGQVRDFYFPYAGLENHIAAGDVHKIGVFVDGVFSWISDEGWNVQVDYEKETMVSHIVARNNTIGVSLLFTDVLYNEKNIFVRTVTVENNASQVRTIKVFFNQQFQISQTTHADTAYYNPATEAVVHYKGRRVFLVSGESGGSRFTDYSVGIFKIEGKEGTWRDAEDGVLSKNPIEHGSVDSTIAFDVSVPAHGTGIIRYWITVAQTFREAAALQDLLLEKTPAHVIETTRNFWHAWVNKFTFTFYGLSPEVIELFKKSLFIIRTHCDNGGGILASGDSDNFRYGRDTYAYVWPRDGAFIAMALDKAGYFDIAHRFYEFANQVITEEGYMLHKYQPDKSLGSSWHPWSKNGKEQLPIQEDETALLVIGLWRHYEKSKDLEFVENVYDLLIKQTARFMMKYREKFVTNLPVESYDLWEERRGVTTFTASTVYGALIAASRFADVLGKRDDEDMYRRAAEEIQQSILSFFYNPETKYFDKLLTVENSVVKKDESFDVSSLFGVFQFGILPADDARMKDARKAVAERLSKPISIGGFARHEKDSFYEVTPDVPGNPWFITTLWMMQYDIACAKTEDDLKKIGKQFDWFVVHALPSGILSEQIHPMTGEQLSVAPLTWSHAEFVLTVISYLERAEALGLCDVCYPVK